MIFYSNFKISKLLLLTIHVNIYKFLDSFYSCDLLSIRRPMPLLSGLLQQFFLSGFNYIWEHNLLPFYFPECFFVLHCTLWYAQQHYWCVFSLWWRLVVPQLKFISGMDRCLNFADRIPTCCYKIDKVFINCFYKLKSIILLSMINLIEFC